MPAGIILALGLLCGLLLSGAGCSRDTPLKPLPPNQLVPALEQAFRKAKPGLRAKATDVMAALKTNDQAKAFMQLQDLALAPELANAQRMVIRRSLITLHEQMAAQAPQGKGEADALQGYHLAK